MRGNITSSPNPVSHRTQKQRKLKGEKSSRAWKKIIDSYICRTTPFKNWNGKKNIKNARGCYCCYGIGGGGSLRNDGAGGLGTLGFSEEAIIVRDRDLATSGGVSVSRGG